MIQTSYNYQTVNQLINFIMKKSFMMLFAGALLAGFTFTSCEKDNGSNGSDAIIDDNGGNGGSTSDLHASLQGSNYYVLFMDDYSFDAIKDKVVADFRPSVVDGVTYINIDVWSNTYSAGTNSGLGFYGGATGWVSFVVGSAGWSGGAWDLYNGTADVPDVDKVTAIDDDLDSYYLHLAYKTNQTGKSHLFYMTWPSAATAGASFAIGETPYVDNGVTYNPIAPVSNDGKFVVGEWNEYEVALKDMGLDFSQEPVKDAINLLAFLSGATAGTTLDLDAIFIYKK